MMNGFTPLPYATPPFLFYSTSKDCILKQFVLCFFYNILLKVYSLETLLGFDSDKTNTNSLRPKKGKSLLTKTKNFVSIDIETTGLSTVFDEIIEIGAIKYQNGEPIDTFSSLIKPIEPIDEFITELTGITNEMLESAPSLYSVLPSFLEFIEDNIIVGHNVNFDINFLYDACEQYDYKSLSNDFIDTMRVSRRLYKDWDNHKLDTLINYFNLNKRELHRGLDDCKLTALCYLRMIEDEHFEEAMIISHKHKHKKPLSLKELVAEEGHENPDCLLYGKVCVFTGALESFTRKEAAQLVINIGGICDNSITKKTNFLILGNNDYCKSIKDGKSSKQKKAEKLIASGADLTIIPESVFLEIIQDN